MSAHGLRVPRAPMIPAMVRLREAPETRRVKFRRRKGDDRGFAMVWAALLLIVLVGFAGFGVDTAKLWFTRQRMQAAADAAAMGGVVFLPGDLPTAITTAQNVASLNGFSSANGWTVTVTQDPNPDRLRVTIKGSDKTYFTNLLGVGKVGITVRAVAEYQGPVPMGSPTNNLGNQPTFTGATAWTAGSSLSTEVQRVNTAPQLWANIAGPNTDKANGDRFTTTYCTSTSTYQCDGAANLEPQSVTSTTYGYFYKARLNVGSGDLTKRLALQAYDPAFVQQGDTCKQYSSSSGDETAFENQLHADSVAAGKPNWDAVGSQTLTTAQLNTIAGMCPGDTSIRGGYETNSPTTYFQVSKPDTTPWNDADNTAVTASTCLESNTTTSQTPTIAGTFPPISGGLSTSSTALAVLLKGSTGGALAVYAQKVFHNYVTICNDTLADLGITTAGTYDVVLRVRTANGAGHNRFALRGALVTDINNSSPDGSKVSLFADGKLPIYMNASGSQTLFYIARLLPNNNSRSLELDLYDIGDAAANGTIQILPPAEATVNGAAFTAFTGCSFSRFPNALNAGDVTASTCTLSNVNASNGYNAQLTVAAIPIPTGYSCADTDPFGCWVRVSFSYPSGTGVTDTTTWTANIQGDPVRLVM